MIHSIHFLPSCPHVFRLKSFRVTMLSGGRYHAFAARPRNRARPRQGEVRGVHCPDVRAEVRGAPGGTSRRSRSTTYRRWTSMTRTTLSPTTTPSWPRTMSSTRSCSGSGTRGSSSGAGRARGRTGRSTTCTRGVGSISSARTATCGRLLRTRMLRIDAGPLLVGRWFEGGGAHLFGYHRWQKDQKRDHRNNKNPQMYWRFR